MNQQPEKKEKKTRPWVRPLIAVVGFFVILFLAAYLLYRFHSRWIIPAGIILAIGWAVFFSTEKDKKE